MEFFTDFCREFEEVSICTLGPDFNHDGVVEAAEAVKVTFGEWLPGTGSGNRISMHIVYRDSEESGRLDVCFRFLDSRNLGTNCYHLGSKSCEQVPSNMNGFRRTLRGRLPQQPGHVRKKPAVPPHGVRR